MSINSYDPPKSPLKRGTLRPFPPFLRGAKEGSLSAAFYRSLLFKHPLSLIKIVIPREY
jgi:hypothetical protein